MFVAKAITNPLAAMEDLAERQAASKSGPTHANAIALRVLSGYVAIQDAVGSSAEFYGAVWEALKNIARLLNIWSKEQVEEGELTAFEQRLEKTFILAGAAFSAAKGVVTPEKALKHHAKAGLSPESKFLNRELVTLLKNPNVTVDEIEALLPQGAYDNKALRLKNCPALNDTLLAVICQKFPALEKLDVRDNEQLTLTGLQNLFAICENLDSKYLNYKGCAKVEAELVRLNKSKAEQLIEPYIPTIKKIAWSIAKIVAKILITSFVDANAAKVVDMVDGLIKEDPKEQPKTFKDHVIKGLKDQAIQSLNEIGKSVDPEFDLHETVAKAKDVVEARRPKADNPPPARPKGKKPRFKARRFVKAPVVEVVA